MATTPAHTGCNGNQERVAVDRNEEKLGRTFLQNSKPSVVLFFSSET